GKIALEFLLEQLGDTGYVNVPEVHIPDVLAVSVEYPGACSRGFNRRIFRGWNCQLEKFSAMTFDFHSNHVVRFCQQVVNRRIAVVLQISIVGSKVETRRFACIYAVNRYDSIPREQPGCSSGTALENRKRIELLILLDELKSEGGIRPVRQIV